MDLQEIENYKATERETFLLEKSYQEAQVWEENINSLEKARQAAPVGTIKRPALYKFKSLLIISCLFSIIGSYSFIVQQKFIYNLFQFFL
jgi:hypothetical protein